MDQPTNDPPAPVDARSPARGFLTGLVGEEIAASRSPWLHEREADAHGVRLIYSLYDLSGSGGAEALAPLLDAAKRLRFSGLNVTHPFKQQVIPFLDELSVEADRIGAVNTVAIRDGRTIGYNTDYLGFGEGLRRGLGGADFRVVAQFGAGGAGAATAYALLDHGTELLRIYDVEKSRAESLVRNLASYFGRDRVQVASDTGTAVEDADGIVNSTPLGMIGHPGSPVPVTMLHSALWVADIVYFPLETELLRTARNIGCVTVDGITMVVFQAAAAFDIFTGLSANRERMLSAAIEHWTR